jgi:hypothetical protein
MYRLFFARLILLVDPARVFPQTGGGQNVQLWLDYDPTLPMGKWSFDLEISQRMLFGPEGWSELTATPTFEYSATHWLDLLSGVTLAYTHQTKDFDSFEARPYVGFRPYYYTRRRIKGIKLVDYFRIEYRAQYTFKADEKTTGMRFRNRFQALVPINKASILLDKAWYLIVDFEAFYNPGDLRERFSAQQRIRFGAGYRLNNTWRCQIIYTLQRARDTTEDPYTTTDSILRFRAIHFF